MKVLYPPAIPQHGQHGLRVLLGVVARMRTGITNEAQAGTWTDADLERWGMVQALDAFLLADASAKMLLENPNAPGAVEAYAPTWPALENFWKVFLKEAGIALKIACLDALARDNAVAEILAGRAATTTDGLILATDA
jgi:hypothetical protein